MVRPAAMSVVTFNSINPGCEYFMALLTRFISTCRRRPASVYKRSGTPAETSSRRKMPRVAA